MEDNLIAKKIQILYLHMPFCMRMSIVLCFALLDSINIGFGSI